MVSEFKDLVSSSQVKSTKKNTTYFKTEICEFLFSSRSTCKGGWKTGIFGSTRKVGISMEKCKNKLLKLLSNLTPIYHYDPLFNV